VAAAGAGAPVTAGFTAPVAESVSLIIAVLAAAGFAGFGAGPPSPGAPEAGFGAGGGIGAAEAPAPGESVRDTSPFSGSPGAALAGLSAAACGGVISPPPAAAGVGEAGVSLGSSAIYTHSRAPFCHA
jgi:hypothetical protein